MLVCTGELYDIIPSFAPDNASSFYDEVEPSRLYARLATAGRCSGLIKVTREQPPFEPACFVKFLMTKLA